MRDYQEEARNIVQQLEDANEPLLYEEYSIPLLVRVLDVLTDLRRRIITIEEELDLMQAGN